MRKKNILILCLLAVAILLFCTIRFGILPYNQAREAEYQQNQTDALTHDITAIQKFKNPYIGNASNTGNLFYALPLNNVPMTFEIDSKACTLTVIYSDTVQAIGAEKVRRNLIYNSAAAMAAIDNLAGITYRFSDESFSFTRTQFEDVLGSPLSDLLEPERWETDVQEPLASADFVALFFDSGHDL